MRDGLPPGTPVPAPAYTAVGGFESNHGRTDEALRVMQRGIRDLEATVGHDAYKLSVFRSAFAVFSAYNGDITTARAEADEALRQARQVGNPSATAAGLWALGKTLIRADPPAALAAYEAYVVLALVVRITSTLGWSLGDVGWLKARVLAIVEVHFVRHAIIVLPADPATAPCSRARSTAPSTP